ncbi:MAG TPA: RNB domain-containing ribonuclease [Pseudonocardiaceae bacterium]|nr:RNB domain-containing ribonuclease [Pseudonocardiaceae bacterium]
MATRSRSEAIRSSSRSGGRDFSAIRAEFSLPAEYPTDALAEVEQVLAADLGRREDATDLPLVTIDPPGAKDLDQALLVRRHGTGYRLDYAIADVGHFVHSGGALDAEARRRGQTLYLPDAVVPLHPTLLSEDAASLLPGEVRPSVLWTIDCDADGEAQAVHVRRATVRSIAQYDYDTVRQQLAAGEGHPSFALLPEFGRLRRELAVDRGAVELQLPEQRAASDGEGGWRLQLRSRVDVEAWNAELSLLTGMCAAHLMLQAGVGVLRTLPDPGPEAMASLRRRAQALGIDWPSGETAARMLAGLDPRRPEALAFHVDATRLLRGAGYTVFDTTTGALPATIAHAGLGAPYAHVTAPLRRLVDRFGAEICLAVANGQDVPEWAMRALPDLPGLMASSDLLASRVERTCLAQVESWVLADRVGEVFTAVVLHAEARTGEVFVVEPPVVARCVGDNLPEGQQVQVRLVEADPARRKVSFEHVGT